MFNKKLIATILCLSMSLMLISCTSDKGSEATIFATITDHAGREVTLESQPKRIVSGYYITSSILISLGVSDLMVGIENKADTRNIYSLAAPELLDLKGVGTSKDFDVEGTAALEPDLIILPLRLKDTATILEELGFDVICVNPENDVLLEETIDMLATATGTEEIASAMKEDANSALDELSKLISNEEKPTVYLAGNSDFLSTAGSNMYQNTLLSQANVINVASEIEDTYWATISYEQLLAYNPEFIIIAPAANYSVEDIFNDSAISELEAVKNGNVWAMPSSLEAWDSPLPSSFLGSLWVASVVHSDLYDFESFTSNTVDFYKNYYDFNVDTASLTN